MEKKNEIYLFTKLFQLATDVVFGSQKKAWWLCEENHEWKATIYSRSRGSGCPHCYKLIRNKKK